MKVTHYFTASLTAPTPAVLYAVKGDGARMAVARLMAGAEPWAVPEGVTAGISYTLPDKTPGYYDRLEDGTPACMIAGNLVSAVIAPVLTGQAGAVKASIVLRDADGDQVSTFPFQLRVEQAPGIVDAEGVPAMGSGFEGKLFYGGPGGALTALELGDGVRVETTEDGTLALVAEGGSGGGGGIDEEKDPTVPAWAKQPQKPAYTAQEVGAMPAGTKIPGKTSELTNDAGFVTKAVSDLANYYTKVQMQELIAAIPRFRVTVVQQLPAAGEELVLYLVPFATAEGQYLEYIWADGRWEIIGSQRVDLTGYATEEWVQEYVEEHSGQNVELDTTLTKSGEAADAKATGDEIKRVEGKIPSIEGLAKTEDIPKVPNWAMKTSKPAYTASEVGALPNTYTPPNQTAEQVGADPKGTAASAVSAHNTNNAAHNDIRLLIEGLTTRLNALANSTDTDLDQMAELVAYIKSNKSLIDGITTSKVSVADIVNNLTTNVANKPLSAAQGVAIKALIDGLYSGKLDASKLTEAINTALAQAKASGDFDGKNGDPGVSPTVTVSAITGGHRISITDKSGTKTVDVMDGEDGDTPKRGVDYWNPTDKAEIEAHIATELAKRGQLRPEPAESLEWLKANGDTSKIYVLPDGYLYMWLLTEKEVDNGPTYTNRLPLAINADGTPYVGDNGEKGYRVGYRYSASSATEKAQSGYDCVGFIPAKAGDIVRIANATQITASNDGSGYCLAYFFTSTFAKTTGSISMKTSAVYENGIASWTVPSYNDIAYFKITLKGVTADTIITVNEEITEGGGTEIVREYAWVSTGHAFVPADYEPRVIKLEEQVKANTADIAALQKGITSTTPIKTWDAPIYDANIPVFQLSAEKAAIPDAEKTVAGVYAKYDALMARHPQYITKTDLGMCSDGVTPVYRYDFREPEPHRGTTGKKEWSETKAKAIIVSGIHWEWGGIFALYNAMEELADNPDLFALRRNTHLIVLPICNPYAVANMSVRNANLVEIHRNFEVDFIYPGESGYIELGERSHGGTEPLSEVETQYIDNIFKANTDAAFFLTCHSNQSDTVYGTGFTWASPATYYMCNMHYRLVDKLSKVWMEKYGDELAAGLADYRTENTPEWDNRLGSAYLSTTNGTETKQATKYGIQATNIEVTDAFLVHGTKANPEPALSSFTMSRGAEVYINFLLTAFGVYDPKDKNEYAPTTV